ncbi:MAG TPA: hypothetical protein VHX65_11885 [Pirellulales bacterium]|nr:hypothetical protein [Pirellulales bacterium]
MSGNLCVGPRPNVQNFGGSFYLLGGHWRFVSVFVVLPNRFTVKTLHPRFDLPLRNQNSNGLRRPDSSLRILGQFVVQSLLARADAEIICVRDYNQHDARVPAATRRNFQGKSLANELRTTSSAGWQLHVAFPVQQDSPVCRASLKVMPYQVLVFLVLGQNHDVAPAVNHLPIPEP